MDFTIPDELVELRERTERFVREEIMPRETDKRQTPHGPTEEFRRELVELARAAGLLAPHVASEWGGLGLDMCGRADVFEEAALEGKHLWLTTVPPRYRSSYFAHIWSTGYAAGYYAYLWSEMLDDDAYQWFEDHGGLTRANGDRFRAMVLSKGNTEDLAKAYSAWLGAEPSTAPMLKDRGLVEGGK